MFLWVNGYYHYYAFDTPRWVVGLEANSVFLFWGGLC